MGLALQPREVSIQHKDDTAGACPAPTHSPDGSKQFHLRGTALEGDDTLWAPCTKRGFGDCCPGN